MARHEHPSSVHVPRGWPPRVRSAMLHVIAFPTSGGCYAITTMPRPDLLSGPPETPARSPQYRSLSEPRLDASRKLRAGEIR